MEKKPEKEITKNPLTMEDLDQISAIGAPEYVRDRVREAREQEAGELQKLKNLRAPFIPCTKGKKI